VNSTPPIFDLVLASPAADMLGGSELRVFSFGEVEGQQIDAPYVVWQAVAGSPENTLADLPDKDSRTTQIDVYAKTRAQARAVATAVRDAMEGDGYMVNGPRDDRDPDTRLFFVSFDFDWIIPHSI
jgi:hypothetical protein